MKKLVASLGLVAGLGMGSAALAGDPETCMFTYDVKGGGLQCIVGKFHMKGTGNITCYGLHGEPTTMPVLVEIGGHPIKPAVCVGRVHIHGATGTFDFHGKIEELLGDWLVGEVDVTAGLGVGAQVTLTHHAKPYDAHRPHHDGGHHHGHHFVSAGLGVHYSRGLAFNVGFSTLTLSPVPVSHHHHQQQAPHQQQNNQQAPHQQTQQQDQHQQNNQQAPVPHQQAPVPQQTQQQDQHQAPVPQQQAPVPHQTQQQDQHQAPVPHQQAPVPQQQTQQQDQHQQGQHGQNQQHDFDYIEEL